MATATINIGYNQSAVVAGVAQTQQALANVGRAAELANQRAAALANQQASARMRNIGGASMQLQDVAVQLQGGASAATVLAQQGSQVASMFGPTGMIVGGVLAVGAGLFSIGQKGSEAFAAMVAESDGLHKSLGKITGAGSLQDIEEWTSKSTAGLKAMRAEIDSLNGLWGGFKAFLGGDTPFERRTKLEATSKRAEMDLRTANESAVSKGADEVRIAQAKADGQEREVIEMEAKLALAKKLAEIEASPFYEPTKKSLAESARQVSEIDLNAKLKLIDEGEATKQMAIDEGEAAKQMARDAMSNNLAALQAEANGNAAVADALRRQQTIRERSLAIQKELAVSAETALGIAQKEDALKHSKAKGGDGDGDGRIKGFSRDRGDTVHGFEGLAGRSFAGLDRYKRLQDGGHRLERKNAAFGDGLSLATLTSPKDMALAKARERQGGKGMAGVDAATAKEMVKLLEQIAGSVAPLGGLE